MNTILDKPTKLRIRRVFKRRKRIVATTTQEVSEQFDTHFVSRIDRLLRIKRFIIGWLLLVALLVTANVFQTLALSGLYQEDRPMSGGTYNEGMVGTYSNANPLYAAGAIDTAVSRLIFAGLLKYDANNNLVGDIAKDYSIDETGRTYVVNLRQDIMWHDKTPLTADDVVFTYQLIQNPDAYSPLRAAWQGVEVSKVNNYAVQFTLTSPFAPFAHSLTTGILPKHIIGTIPVTQVRSHSFNTIQPVGSGPFVFKTLQFGSAEIGKTGSLISLTRNYNYHNGAPKLENLILHTYDTEQQLVNAYEKREINAMAGLKAVPKGIADSTDTNVHSFQTTAAMMVFFKTTGGVLADASVRKALVYGTYRAEIIRTLNQNLKPVRQPILMGQVGYDPQLIQPKYDATMANKLLDDAGWIKNNSGVRTKNGQVLSFRLYASNNSISRAVINQLKQTWQPLGVNVQPVFQDTTDFQTTLELHTYDAVLHGISIGADPDVYAYWHSSQADPVSGGRLNFSEYKSSIADTSLEAGRTRHDTTVRALKYKPFLKAWQDDAPAVALFRPRIYYITRGTVNGLNEHLINTDADRYYSVSDWSILTARVAKD
jgi:peptide/nickel transport system substrate-binding protein